MQRTSTRWRSGSKLSTATLLATLGLITGLTLTSAPNPAQACGGFFCSAARPVDQSAERIIFVNHEDGSVSMVVQVLYQGPAEQFSWVVPVQGVPDVAVSSNLAFTRLQSATNPRWNMDTTIEGECDTPPPSMALPGPRMEGQPPPETMPPPMDNANVEPEPVQVVDSGSVGPYDYEIITVNEELEDPADVAVEWLTENGYDVGDLGPEVLRPYLVNGLNLLAFKLTKSSSSGSIRPVVMTWQPSAMGMGQSADGRPSVPVRPTAVAARDNMGVMVWTVGSARAIPFNYRSLVLNEAAINWLSGGSNYATVINLAADEAGGHGFVTEMAQPSSRVENVVWTEDDENQWNSIRESNFQGNSAALLDRLDIYRGWDGLEDALREADVTAPVPLSNVASCPSCFALSVDAFSTSALKAAVERNVIEPMKATQEMLTEREYITRLYTTLSADEMDEDPIFDFNDSRGDVDNRHTATRVIECGPGVYEWTAPWRAHLPSGITVRGEGFSWPVSTNDVPVNLRVEQERPMGEPTIIDDNTETVDLFLEENNATFPSPAAVVTCTCAQPGESTASIFASLAMLGLLGLGLRRRRG